MELPISMSRTPRDQLGCGVEPDSHTVTRMAGWLLGRTRWTGLVNCVSKACAEAALGDITVEPVEVIVNAESGGH